MPQDERISGPIDGLRLSPRAWMVLQRENITTMDRLRAVADRMERLVPGIGPRTAKAIRAELARLAASERQPPDEGRSSGSP